MNGKSVVNERLRYLALVEARRTGKLPETIETREVGSTRGWVKFASLYDAAAQLQININSALCYMLVRFGTQVVKNGSSRKYEIRYMYNDLPVHVSLSAQGQSCEENNVIVTRQQSKNLSSSYNHTSFDDLNSMSMRYAMTHIQEKRRYRTKRNATTATIELPREILRRIIMFAVSSKSTRDTSEKPLQVDMYRGISDLRGTCKAFYFTILESWSNFQCTFFNRVWERCRTERLQMCDVLSHIDPFSYQRCLVTSFQNSVHLADSLVFIARKRIKDILRFYSTPYLMIMATNERNLRGQNNYGIPTLSGFTQFIDNKRLTLYVKRALACDPPQYAEAIECFHTIPEPWNMLSIGSCRGIDAYLAMTNGEIIDSWQRKSEEFGRKEMRCFGLHNKITALTASNPERVFLPCELRPPCELNNTLCELVPFVWDLEFSINQDQYHIVYDFVLPVRLMRTCDDCITMNIPLNMMREIIEDDVVLNEVFEKELLPANHGLDEENFMQAASIIISRRCAYECELLFEKEYFDGHFCVLADCCEAVPYLLHHNYKVEDTSSGKELALSSLPFGEWNATPLRHEWGTTSLVSNDNFGFTLNVDHRCMHRSFCNGEFIDLRLARAFCPFSNQCNEHFVNNRVQLWLNYKQCIVKADEFATLVNDYIDLTWERHQFAFGTKKKTKQKQIHNETRNTKKHKTRSVA